MPKTRNNKGRKAWKFTEEDFDQIKYLSNMSLNDGKPMTIQMMAKITGWGPATISRAKMVDSYEDYTALVQRYMMNKKAQEFASDVPAVDYPEDGTVTSEDMLNDMSKKGPDGGIPANPDGNALERIACALERLADAWENTPQKKRSIFKG